MLFEFVRTNRVGEEIHTLVNGKSIKAIEYAKSQDRYYCTIYLAFDSLSLDGMTENRERNEMNQDIPGTGKFSQIDEDRWSEILRLVSWFKEHGSKA